LKKEPENSKKPNRNHNLTQACVTPSIVALDLDTTIYCVVFDKMRIRPQSKFIRKMN